MIETIADAMPRSQGTVLRRLTTPALTDRVLRLAGSQAARVFDPLLHNTVSPTIVRGGVRVNVVPSEVELTLDGRVLPGFDADDLVRELRDLLGPDAEIRVDSFDPYPGGIDLGLFELLAAAVRAQDPAAIPIPYVTMATTDGRHFARLGHPELRLHADGAARRLRLRDDGARRRRADPDRRDGLGHGRRLPRPGDVRRRTLELTSWRLGSAAATDLPSVPRMATSGRRASVMYDRTVVWTCPTTPSTRPA